jgi:hypothetical protein
VLTLPPSFFLLFLVGLSVTTNPTQTTGTGTTDTDTNDLNPTGTTTSKNGADRTKAAGGISLIFGALAAMVL